MKRYFWAIIMLIIASAIQGNLPGWMTVFGAKPDLVLIVLIIYALSADPDFGAVLGFIAGLIQGSVVGLSLGSFIVTRTITGFLAGIVHTRLFSENPIVPMLSAVWLTLVCEGMFLLANPKPSFPNTIRTLLGECILNAIFAFLLYVFLRHLDTRRKIRLANARL
ncbi:rod shape-determining protein MreD [bacterium]|nr:rod shape-determining protein MreD [bacterium]